MSAKQVSSIEPPSPVSPARTRALECVPSGRFGSPSDPPNRRRWLPGWTRKPPAAAGGFTACRRGACLQAQSPWLAGGHHMNLQIQTQFSRREKDGNTRETQWLWQNFPKFKLALPPVKPILAGEQPEAIGEWFVRKVMF